MVKFSYKVELLIKNYKGEIINEILWNYKA